MFFIGMSGCAAILPFLCGRVRAIFTCGLSLRLSSLRAKWRPLTDAIPIAVEVLAPQLVVVRIVMAALAAGIPVEAFHGGAAVRAVLLAAHQLPLGTRLIDLVRAHFARPTAIPVILKIFPGDGSIRIVAIRHLFNPASGIIPNPFLNLFVPNLPALGGYRVISLIEVGHQVRGASNNPSAILVISFFDASAAHVKCSHAINPRAHSLIPPFLRILKIDLGPLPMHIAVPVTNLLPNGVSVAIMADPGAAAAIVMKTLCGKAPIGLMLLSRCDPPFAPCHRDP